MIWRAQHDIKPTEASPPIRYGAVGRCLEQVAAKARQEGATVHMPRIGCGLAGGTWEQMEPILQDTLCAAGVDVFVYDFAQNRVPGMEEFEEPAYWRDVGTLAALAAAQQDATGQRPRFNLWNRRWPIRAEYDLPLLDKLTVLDTATVASPWRVPGKELRSDERLPAS